MSIPLALRAAPMVPSSGTFALPCSRISASYTAIVLGFDRLEGGVGWFLDQTNAQLKSTDNFGANIGNNKLMPSGVTNPASLRRFKNHVYLLAATGVYRSPPKPVRNDQFEWSAALLTPTAGAGFLGVCMEANDDFLFVCEYGDPTGGPKLYRTSDGVTYDTVLTDATARHFHAVALDPYRPGHVYVTSGDGIANTTWRSTDNGDTWSVVVSSSVWQAVQVSFCPRYVWMAADNQRGTVMVMDRDRLEPFWASTNWHAMIARPAGNQFYRNAYHGVVDPDTGVYYAVANDVSAGGDRAGLFYLPKVGGELVLLDELTTQTSAVARPAYIAGGQLWFGQFKKGLLAVRRA